MGLDIIKYLPIALKLVQSIGPILDQDAEIRDRAAAAASLLANLADLTETQFDDEVAEVVIDLVNSDEFWATVDIIVSVFNKEDGPFESVADGDDAELDPATILLLIELAAMIFKFIRDRR